MIRLVFSIILFIILAVFIALNAQYTTTINFFGYLAENVSVAAVVTITMAVGVVFSFLLYLSNYFSKHRSERVKIQKQKNRETADELAKKAKEIEQVQPPGSEAAGLLPIAKKLGRRKKKAKPPVPPIES